MFPWLKKHFIPHEGNEHRPHILRDLGTRNIIAIVIFLEIFTFLLPTLNHINTTGGMTAEVISSVLANLTNGERQAQDLPTLTVSPLLNEAAEMKANDMATNGYFAHTSPTGKTPWYWLEQVGYNYQYAGENLAINFSDSQDVTNAWMASPTHKANIVKENYTEIGTGVATGMYQGKETVFVTQVYANPLPVEQTEKVSAKTEPATTEIAPSVTATTKESANILGAETSTNVGNNPSNIVIDKLVVIDKTPKPTFWQMLISSPRNTTNIILYVVFGIIVVALLLYIFIKRKNYHIDLITNGLIVIAVVGAIFIGNYYLTHRNMVITQSLDYSNQSK
jgi:hypothetical protein